MVALQNFVHSGRFWWRCHTGPGCHPNLRIYVLRSQVTVDSNRSKWYSSTHLIRVPLSTLIDSTPGVLSAWATFAAEYNFDPHTVAHASHGRRLYDTLKQFCNIHDEIKLQVRPTTSDQSFSSILPQEEILRFEQQVLDGGPIALPGAIDLLNQVRSFPFHPVNTISPCSPAPRSPRTARLPLDHRHFCFKLLRSQSPRPRGTSHPPRKHNNLQ